MAESLSTTEMIAAGEQQRVEHLRAVQERLENTAFTRKTSKFKWLLSRSKQFGEKAIAARELMFDSGIEKFIAASRPYPQIQLCLAAKDDGAMEAMVDWITTFNDDKWRFFEENVFPNLPPDIQQRGQGKSRALKQHV